VSTRRVAGSTTGIWLARTRGRETGEDLGENGADRQDVNGPAGRLMCGDGSEHCSAGPTAEKTAHNDFSIFNPFPIE
jgi:hypothetical protein